MNPSVSPRSYADSILTRNNDFICLVTGVTATLQCHRNHHRKPLPAAQIFDCPDGVLSSGPGRAADHTAKIGAMEVRVFVGENVGVDVAKRRVWPVFESVVEGLNDFLLEPGRAG